VRRERVGRRNTDLLVWVHSLLLLFSLPLLALMILVPHRTSIQNPAASRRQPVHPRCFCRKDAPMDRLGQPSEVLPPSKRVELLFGLNLLLPFLFFWREHSDRSGSRRCRVVGMRNRITSGRRVVPASAGNGSAWVEWAVVGALTPPLLLLSGCSFWRVCEAFSTRRLGRRKQTWELGPSSTSVRLRPSWCRGHPGSCLPIATNQPNLKALLELLAGLAHAPRAIH
jgi:hypothetical protein